MPRVARARKLGMDPSREPDGVNRRTPEERAQTRAGRGAAPEPRGEPGTEPRDPDQEDKA